MSLLVASTASADTMNLAWDAAGDVSGYSVYVGTTSGSYSQRIDVGDTTSFAYPSATAGQRYCFAVSAYNAVGEGPKSSEVCGYSNRYPTLANPGNQSSTVSQSKSLQLNGSDPDGRAVSFNATGLPPGFSVMSTTGYISGSGTTAGTYNVIALVSDGVLSATQSFSWTVNPAAPTADTTAPSVSIATPTPSSTFSTAVSTISMTGTGADNIGVQQVSWANDRGGNGTASGTTSWNTGSITLLGGTNNITITARDAAGNVGTDSLSVTYTPPTSSTSVVLSSSMTPFRNKRAVNLAWTQAPWSGVTVYRNGNRISKTANDGSYTDQLRSAGSYTYKVCDLYSSVCSNTVTVYY
jgi:Putative Ig domain/Fibronectin type III domain